MCEDRQLRTTLAPSLRAGHRGQPTHVGGIDPSGQRYQPVQLADRGHSRNAHHSADRPIELLRV